MFNPFRKFVRLPYRPRAGVRRWNQIGFVGIGAVVFLIALPIMAIKEMFAPGEIMPPPSPQSVQAPQTTQPKTTRADQPPAKQAQPSVNSAAIQVIDGDTIRYEGATVRLVGFNAPETGQRALCEAERRLGQQATRRLQELVRSGPLGFQLVACSCRPGTEGTQQCNFGRRCGVLTANGRDVGAILIAERLAVPFQCGATRCPPTPRPWC
jgi:endonuclease YncB( thermonuclease family)